MKTRGHQRHSNLIDLADSMELFIHAIERGSRANGPGSRLVVWTQGCSLKCKGCWNPETHDFGGTSTNLSSILGMLIDGGYEGLTVSGGEPLDQAEPVFQLGLMAKSLGFSSVLFSGYSLEGVKRKLGTKEIAQAFDVLLSDPYVSKPEYQTVTQALSNKTITFFSQRYSLEDFCDVPACEVVVGLDGDIRVTGLVAMIFSDAPNSTSRTSNKVD
jgi:anaerobic ribonucleoside-triphosphate reductase activating protein